MQDRIYDLGEIHAAARRAGSSVGNRDRHDPAARSVRPALAGTLSLIVPGAGQLLLGDPAGALFFAACFGCAASTCWAALTLLDRIVAALALLDLPRWTATAGLSATVACAAVLHASGAVHAHRCGCRFRQAAIPLPGLAGAASAVLPGWGQILAGRLGAAATFILLDWVLATAWLVVTPAAQEMLRPAAVTIPDWLRDGWGPSGLVGASVAAWSAAVWDAAAGAARRRGPLVAT